MILEAMKMEHTITAARTGQVKKVYKGAGDQVKMGEQLIELT